MSEPYCVFCGIEREDSSLMIRGPSLAVICAQCVINCMQAIGGEIEYRSWEPPSNVGPAPDVKR